MRFKGLTILAITGILAAAGASQMANAQQFTLESVTAAPGATVDVRLFVTGGPVDTSALNFTVRYNSDQVTGITGARGTAPGLTNSYIYDQNNPSASEYRGVLYAADNSVASFSTASNAHVATLSVTLSPSLSDGETVILTLINSFDTDGITGLLGLSNSTGTSIVPPGGNPAQTRPNAVNGTITIEAGPLFDIDFTGRTSIPDGFISGEIPIVPTNPAGLISLQQTTNGYVMTLQNRNPNPGRIVDTTFARVATLPNMRLVPDAGSVLMVSADFASNAPTPRESPFVRIAAQAQNNSFNPMVVIQETDTVAPFLLPANNNVVRHTLAAYVPSYVVSETFNGEELLQGYALAFDMQNDFIPTAPVQPNNGAAITLRRLTAEQVALPAGGNVVYSAQFGEGETDGFEPLIVDFVTAPVATGFTSTDNGLEIGFDWLSGAGTAPRDINQFQLALGWWERTLPITINSNRLYRFDAVVATTAANTQNTHTFRFRTASAGNLSGGGGKYVTNQSIESITLEANARPTAEGRNYTSVIKFPEAANGQNFRFSFDVFSAMVSSRGSVVLKSLTVTEIAVD